MASALVRYSMWRPSRRAWTRPTSLRTRRCLETEGCSTQRASTISLTVRSLRARKESMSRRRGSATALKASEVVEARGMKGEYIPIWEYVKRNFELLLKWNNSLFLLGLSGSRSGHGRGGRLGFVGPKVDSGSSPGAFVGSEIGIVAGKAA